MTKLFIANCKSQVEVFSYRVPGLGSLITDSIPPGQQRQIFKDTDQHTLELIVEQHRKYGLIHVSDIDRTKPFISLAYQFDKPITQNHLMYGVEHNKDVLTEAGKEQRDKAAVAISNNLERAAEESQNRVRLGEVSLEIEEQKQQGDNSPGISEVIQVAKRGERASKPGSERTKGRANARA